jgi:predicted transcriptional regulator
MAGKRSQSYPAFSLEFCVDLVTKIYNEYGSSSLLKREEIAQAVGVTEATVQMRVSSAVQYGLLDRSHGEGYRPSSSFINIYKPYNEEERRKALIDTLSNPLLYKKLLDDIDGGIVPTVKALSTILFRKYGISESASEKAAQTFIDNLNYVELIGTDKHIRLRNGVESSNTTGVKVESGLTKEVLVKQKVQSEFADDFREINIPLTEKKKAVLQVPINVKRKDIEIIKAQIDVIALSIEE